MCFHQRDIFSSERSKAAGKALCLNEDFWALLMEKEPLRQAHGFVQQLPIQLYNIIAPLSKALHRIKRGDDMNKCKICCSNRSCPWNSCYEAETVENCANDVAYEVCSCARYVDIPMKVINVNGLTTEEFQADAIAILENISKAVCGISDSIKNCCGVNEANNNCNARVGCNGFNAYDTSNTQGCGYSNASGNYGCSKCGRCR